MSSVAADIRDLDDTVARPPRVREQVESPVEDLEKTITVQRSARPLPTLVEPPPAAAPGPPTPLAPPAPDVRDNVWSHPVPERPRPFRLRLADGTLVPLDQPVYLGRKPSVPRIHPGGTPLLVTLDSPQREVSSTHLELTMVGGTIVASDTKSTNGSVLRMPGAEPRTLIGGESAVVTPGTVIELGDGNLIELLAPDLDAAPPESSGVPR
ncbi:MAG: FHA domain-containing protein [Pseudolysinimonas sp.]